MATKPDDVPKNSKHPNSRPPSGFREHILKSPLPLYSGPYSVGMMDIEVLAREPRVFSDIKRDHRHLLTLETVLFSVYYPSGFGSGQGKSPEGQKRWGRQTWLGRPRVELAKGYAKFAGLPSLPTVCFFGLTTAFTKIPAFRNAKLANHWPPEQNSRECGYEVKNQAGSPPPGEPEKPIFPLLIFSHGLGGTRTTYSSVCGEFASYGFIVISLEHRDGSGPRTFINLPDEGKNMATGEDVDISDEDRKRGFKRMDYVYPKNNTRDTMPGNEQGVDSELRTAQIQLRLAEIEEAYHVMTLIHDGKGDWVAKGNLRDKATGAIGGSSRGLRGVDFSLWKDRFHIQDVTMLGHSFGAATAVEVLRDKDCFHYVGQGIIYDIWGAPLKTHHDDSNCRIHTPLLGINSEAFMYWPDNFKLVMELCKEAKEQDQLVWLMTVRGSVHISQSDFSLLYPRLSSLLFKMTVNPRRAIDLNVNASLEFLKHVMPAKISAMNRGTDEHLLEVSTLEELPVENKPDEEWTAVRLKIPHEFRIRLTPDWVRRYARNRKGQDSVQIPKDPTGKVLIGIGDFAVGDEIWMHVAPTKEELSKHGVSPTRELENHQGSGMVDVTGQGGRSQGNHKGIEQKYMERG